jgi:hypothetical protein
MGVTTVLTGKSLKLTFADVEYHQQTTLARVDVEPVTEEVAPIGVDPVTIASGYRRTLNLTTLQDWPELDSLCGLIEAAADAEGTLEFELVMTNANGDTATASGTAQAQSLPFGGEAGVLTGDVALPITVWGGIVRVAGP